MKLPTPIDAVFTVEADFTMIKKMISLGCPFWRIAHSLLLPRAYGKLPMPTFAIDDRSYYGENRDYRYDVCCLLTLIKLSKNFRKVVSDENPWWFINLSMQDGRYSA